MHLTTKTDYCLRVLIYLQEHKGLVKIQKIADTYKISKNHLSVAVNRLSELGYILSTSGPQGGIEFNPQMANKTVAELVVAIETFKIVECFDPETNTCTLNSHCNLKKMLNKASNAFLNQLKEYRIKDLV